MRLLQGMALVSALLFVGLGTRWVAHAFQEPATER